MGNLCNTTQNILESFDIVEIYKFRKKHIVKILQRNLPSDVVNVLLEYQSTCENCNSVKLIPCRKILGSRNEHMSCENCNLECKLCFRKNICKSCYKSDVLCYSKRFKLHHFLCWDCSYPIIMQENRERREREKKQYEENSTYAIF